MSGEGGGGGGGGGGGEVKLDPLIKNSWLSETIQYIELKFSDINNIPILLHTVKNIVGFHMTSLKFKLKNYRSYRDFTFTMHYSS